MEGAQATGGGVAARVPLATYRVQFNAGFGFRDAEKIVPYLAELGVDTLYASPIFRANPGSTHGYDVVDYGRLNPEIGDEADFDALVAALRRHGMGLLLDVVPNHMGIASGRNGWWLDLLENGRFSPYADFFDVDWRPLNPALRGKVLLPILGDRYGEVLERGELRLCLEEGAFTVRYYETPLPVAPPTYPLVLRHRLDDLVEALPADDLELLELQSIVTALERLPGGEIGAAPTSVDEVAERQREQVVAKRRLAELMRALAPVREAVEASVVAFNGTLGDSASFDLLDGLLAAQAYRLAFWRVAAEEINYRRFFAINELAAIRQEVPAVFAASHALLLRLVAEGKVAGVRIDHPDGLWDPAGYFRALQIAVGGGTVSKGAEGAEQNDGASSSNSAPGSAATSLGSSAPSSSAPSAPSETPPPLPLYLVAEKILEHGEGVPEEWAVHGTVGYEFAAAATGLFVDGTNRRAFDELYGRFLGEKPSYPDLVYQCKLLMMRTALVSEVNILAQALNRIADQDRHSRDFTLNTLRDALRETIACFPVYRTYVLCEEGVVSERDRRYVEAAVAEARRRNPAIDPSVFAFLEDVLLLRHPADLDEAQRAERCRFGMKFQQLTGPVMAKGVEDTAFYRFNRLVSLNEVGGDPSRFGTTLAEFHRQNAERRRRRPHGLLASSTHDTKRSEDVRARIDVLSELPREWRAALNRWARLNRRHKTRIGGRPAPDRADEYLLYQTLLGAWPDEAEGRDGAEFADRIVAYLEKATREAQRRTDWTNPDEAYEEATRRFVRALLDPETGGPFLEDLASLRATVVHAGAFNALAQLLLKLSAPGVPDLYQGTELWDLSLVDPDNRRPVDFAERARLARALARRRTTSALARELVATKADGRIKLYLAQRALACRRERPDLFADGEYVPLAARGERAEHA
ncbi:MAG: malto-oligosyltrehalose synthase, partial [Chloroflexota bacterium]|nr:malto-oligosyltrehalose synthase [Chloroflexota bacterium]